MDKQDAKLVLKTKLDEYRKLDYASLVAKIDEIDCLHVIGAKGVEYQIEVLFMWDSRPHGDLRVTAGIDDGGWSAFVPLCDDFVIAPDGRFVGE